MSKKTTLEQAYFHINNGGITFSIVERIDILKNSPVYPKPSASLKVGDGPKLTPISTETLYDRSWRFKVATNQFGSSTEYSFPIVPLIVRWTIAALQRVLDRMEEPQSRPTHGLEYAFRDLAYCSLSARDGKPVDEYWPHEPTTNVGRTNHGE